MAAVAESPPPTFLYEKYEITATYYKHTGPKCIDKFMAAAPGSVLLLLLQT